ncbi:MAG: hypothetical protein PGN12_13985 [Sphingomonas phyllosphaerae]
MKTSDSVPYATVAVEILKQDVSSGLDTEAGILLELLFNISLRSAKQFGKSRHLPTVDLHETEVPATVLVAHVSSDPAAFLRPERRQGPLQPRLADGGLMNAARDHTLFHNCRSPLRPRERGAGSCTHEDDEQDRPAPHFALPPVVDDAPITSASGHRPQSISTAA